MAKKKLKIYYVTGISPTVGTLEENSKLQEFIIAHKRKEAEQMAEEEWGIDSHPVATRIRLKSTGFLKYFKKYSGTAKEGR